MPTCLLLISIALALASFKASWQTFIKFCPSFQGLQNPIKANRFLMLAENSMDIGIEISKRQMIRLYFLAMTPANIIQTNNIDYHKMITTFSGSNWKL